MAKRDTDPDDPPRPGWGDIDFGPVEDLRPEDDDYDLYCELNFDEGDDGEPVCRHCGKPLSDFSDMGCGYCDRRSPEWGLLD